MYLGDSAHVIHVAKAGNDANGGVAQQYPINLVADAKLTITAAVAAATAGDSIIIWPGDYNEDINASAKALNFFGTNKYLCRIHGNTTGIGTLRLGSKSSIKNLWIENTGIASDTYAVEAQDKTHLVIDNCFIYGSYASIHLAGSSFVRMDNVQCLGKRNGFSANTVADVIVNNCIFKSDGSYGTGEDCFGANISGYAVYNNCHFVASRSDASSKNTMGFNSGYIDTRIIMNNCVIRAFTTGASPTGGVYGARTSFTIPNPAGVLTQFNLNNCSIQTAEGGNASEIFDISAERGNFDLFNTFWATKNEENNFRVYSFPNTALGADNKILISSDAQNLSASLDVNAKLVNSATPASLTNMTAAFKAMTGITEGGTWSYAKQQKVLAAYLAGKWQLKSGETEVYEILDPDDGSTVVLEITFSNTTPHRQIAVQI